ncbi:SDR family oxidoreductase [Streptomyces sp. RB6PN25]|uniref:SDR family oxidoreductase n=1 Tax=Streptomyces humicola TaxID=2953240 RepID=A0ABT1PRM3_9ACTN|nr:SDR family oxidoreductase [Streptomyces humicola]MCQ4079220.1 SDR family oxidoreductase [Streptomyces humicola]
MGGRLEGRTAIVTGGATGIGLAISRRLLSEDARVVVAALAQDDLKAAFEELSGVGRHRPAGFVGDLAAPGTASELLRTACTEFGQVDILVNNAGGGVIRPTLEHTEESLRATIDNNLWTTLRCILAVLPHMVERRYGRIVNIGAESVRNGLTDHAIYNAAKGGVHGMTSGLAREFAESGITVNTVAPSYVETPELRHAQSSGALPQRLACVIERAVELIPMGRPGGVDDIAGAVAYLASQEAAFVTGQVISINGGSSMG